MLGLTENAIVTVNDLSKGWGGLRIFGERAEDELVLSAELVDGPSTGDEVIADGGAVVFVDPATADALADKRLDARFSEGQVQLTLLDRS